LYFGDPKKNNTLSEVIDKMDIIMFLRIQHERHAKLFNIKDYNEKYGLNKNNVEKLKEKSIFMHPGPINQGVEMTYDVSFDHKKSRILKQVNNGVYMRMAILEKFCK
jgi:aspartate carbamoyltransferase catalytic subunit